MIKRRGFLAALVAIAAAPKALLVLGKKAPAVDGLSEWKFAVRQNDVYIEKDLLVRYPLRTVRTGLPQVQWRLLNQGVNPQDVKGMFAQTNDVLDDMPWVEVDKAVAKLGKPGRSWRE